MATKAAAPGKKQNDTVTVFHVWAARPGTLQSWFSNASHWPEVGRTSFLADDTLNSMAEARRRAATTGVEHSPPSLPLPPASFLLCQ